MFNTVNYTGNQGFKLNTYNNENRQKHSSGVIQGRLNTLNNDVFCKNRLDNASLSLTGKLIDQFKSRFSLSFKGNSTKPQTKEAKLKLYRENLAQKLIKEIGTENSKDISSSIRLLGKLEKQEALPHLIRILKLPEVDNTAKNAVIEALSNFKTQETVQVLIDTMNDNQFTTKNRSLAALSLAKIKNRRASRPLVEVLSNKNENPSVRAAAANALAEFSSIRNNEELLKALSDESAKVKIAAAKSLGKVQEKNAISALMSLLSDTNKFVVRATITALGDLKATQAEDLLLDKLDSDDNITVQNTIEALKNLNKDISPKLNQIIANQSNSTQQRKNAIDTASRLHYQNCETPIISVIKNNFECDELRYAAIKAITDLKNGKSGELLAELLTTPSVSDDLKLAALKGLKKTGNKSAVSVVLKTLEENFDRNIRLGCLKTLKSIALKNKGDLKLDIEPVIRELNTTDPEIKAEVLETLGIISSDKAADILLEFLKNEYNTLLQGIAVKSLGQLKDKKAVKPLMKILLTTNDDMLKTQTTISLYQLGQKAMLTDLFKNTKIDNKTLKAVTIGLMACGENDISLRDYLKPGLNVSALHRLGLSGHGVEIATIDKPVDLTHPEFEDRVIIEPLAHGTLVAGNIAGINTGVAPKSIIHSYNAFNDKDIAVSEIIEKIVDQKLSGQNDIKVINISLGYDAKYYRDREVIQEVIKCNKAIDLANKAGISVVIAAGNEGDGPRVFKNNIGTLNLLAFNQNSVVVGAVDTNGTPDDPSDDTRASFSSFPLADSKKQIDVMAPGMKIDLPYPGGLYRVASGTSFSAPFVSGVIALMLEVNPELNPQEIQQILNSTAQKLKGVVGYKQGNGEVVPHEAVLQALRLVNSDEAAKMKQKLDNLLNKKAA
jgi:HEAT repeat protein